MIICLSPNLKNTDFSLSLSLDDKITIFEDRIKGWQLNIAKKCAEVPHSGFAVLHIIISYVESIAKYQDGFVRFGESKKYFKQGLLNIVPFLKNITKHEQDIVVKKLYEGVRCGLYHGGMTSKGIFITGDIDKPLEVKDNNLFIHPNRLLDQIWAHFDGYIKQLRDTKNKKLRENFEKRFDM